MTWEQPDAFLAAAAPETRYATLFAVLAKAGLRGVRLKPIAPIVLAWARALRSPDTREGRE